MDVGGGPEELQGPCLPCYLLLSMVANGPEEYLLLAVGLADGVAHREEGWLHLRCSCWCPNGCI